MSDYVKPSQQYKNVEFDSSRVHLLWNCCAIVKMLMELQDKVADIDHKVENIPDDIDKYFATVNTEINNIKADITELQNEITSIVDDIGDVDADITALQARVTDAEGGLTAVGTRIDNLSGDVAANTSAISALDTRITANADAIEALQEDTDVWYTYTDPTLVFGTGSKVTRMSLRYGKHIGVINVAITTTTTDEEGTINVPSGPGRTFWAWNLETTTLFGGASGGQQNHGGTIFITPRTQSWHYTASGSAGEYYVTIPFFVRDFHPLVTES